MAALQEGQGPSMSKMRRVRFHARTPRMIPRRGKAQVEMRWTTGTMMQGTARRSPPMMNEAARMARMVPELDDFARNGVRSVSRIIGEDQ